MAQLTFTLLGTGSSGGVPRIGNEWGVCDPAEPRNRRTRCAAMIELRSDGKSEPTRILIDTSPDMREQLLRAGVGRIDAVVFTHDHADQTHGLDDLRAIALRMRRQVPVHMDAATAGTLTRRFDYCFEGRGAYPPILDLQALIRPDVPLTIEGPGGALTLLPLDQEHGPIRSLAFRIGSLAYCNDVSDIPESTLEQLTGLDVLIMDALRYTPHPTHANLEQALIWISQLAPRRAVLTNLHIDMDYATLRQELPEGVVPGYDGQTIEITI